MHVRSSTIINGYGYEVGYYENSEDEIVKEIFAFFNDNKATLQKAQLYSTDREAALRKHLNMTLDVDFSKYVETAGSYILVIMNPNTLAVKIQ